MGLGIVDDVGGLNVVATKPFTILGSPGNDNISINSSEQAIAGVTVNGGSGDDSINIDQYTSIDSSNPEPQPIVAVGGSGNDLLYVDSDAAPTASVFGGSGDDRILLGQMQVAANPRAVDGGPGQDTLDLSAFDIDSTHEPTYYMGEGVEDFIGSSQDSDYRVIGNELDNKIYVANQVSVQGMAGDDLIACQDRADCSLSGGKGDDTLLSGDGNPQLGMAGGNELVGGAGKDTADYSQSLSFTYGELNRVTSFSFDPITKPLTISLDNQSNDGLAGEGDNVQSDVETVLGGSGNDVLLGDSADNELVGNGGDDTLYGGGGNDTLIGGGGKDHLFGEDGDDLLEARGGSKDTLDG